MIDFRYHLVSLISVFLALALGIVLGAGPLNETIGDQLTGQVEELRVDRERLREELDETEAARESAETYLAGAAPQLLASRLEGRSVAVVTLPETRSEDVAEIRRALELAGASVTAEVAITEEWSNPDTASFRDSFSGQIVDYLVHPPAGTASTDRILGLALGQALTDSGLDGRLSEEAQTLLELLTGVSDPLLDVVTVPEEAASATVVVGPATWPLPEEPDDDAQETLDARRRQLASQAELAAALAATAEGGMTVGSARLEYDLVAMLRSEAPYDEAVTTVDGVTTAIGWVNAPMALATAISGTVGHYGFGLDAQATMPDAVYLPPPAPDPGPNGEDAGDEDGDGAEGAGEEDSPEDAETGDEETGTEGSQDVGDDTSDGGEDDTSGIDTTGTDDSGTDDSGTDGSGSDSSGTDSSGAGSSDTDASGARSTSAEVLVGGQT